MIINEFVVLHKEATGGLLFNPRNGLVYRVNTTGCIIWKSLQSNTRNWLENAINALVSYYGDCAPEKKILEQEVNNFVAALAVKKFVYDFNGNASQAALLAGKEPQFNDRPLYMLSSMRRVFNPGDALVLKDIYFEDFQPGDIVVFQHDDESSGVVHRIVARTETALITMGDNNPTPDWRPVTRRNSPRLVVEKISPDGKRHPVSCGKAGMAQFRRNRLRRTARSAFSRVGNAMLPLMFWRIEPEEKVVRGDVIMFYHKRRMVARYDSWGLLYSSLWMKLRYRIPLPAFTVPNKKNGNI